MGIASCARCGATAAGLSPDADFGSVRPRCVLEVAPPNWPHRKAVEQALDEAKRAKEKKP